MTGTSLRFRRAAAGAVGTYLLAQCAGAAAATLALTLAAFSIEWLLSFGLMFVIMAAATDPRVTDGFAPIAVGLSMGFCALMGGPLTGASMNPSRSFGPALIGNLWRAHRIY